MSQIKEIPCIYCGDPVPPDFSNPIGKDCHDDCEEQELAEWNESFDLEKNAYRAAIRLAIEKMKDAIQTLEKHLK